MWLVTASRTHRLLQEHGCPGAELLGLLRDVAQGRRDDEYGAFVGHVIEILQALTNTPTVGGHPGVLLQEAAQWVEFTERHVLAEFLAGHFSRELLVHEGLLDRGLATMDALPALSNEDDHTRQRRERYNSVRRAPPLLQQLQAAPPAALDPRGHRLEWTGAIVGETYDLFQAGYHTGGMVPLLLACISERHFAEYEARARAYVREAENQLGNYTGELTTSPLSLEGWTRMMEQRLWEAFVMHGLDMSGEPFLSSDSASSSDAVTGDEASMMQRPRDRWLKGGGGNRRRRDRARARAATPANTSRSPRCTRETRNLAEIAHAARHRGYTSDRGSTERAKPKPKERPTPKAPARPPPNRSVGAAAGGGSVNPSDRAASSSDPMPITVDMAVDTWMLALGLRNISDTVGGTFLPEPVMSNLGETFLSHGVQDRLTLMLAIHRLALSLLAAMGEAAQQAAAAEQAGTAEVTVRVDPEDAESDETMWMQMPSSPAEEEDNDWEPLMRGFVAAMEGRRKPAQARIAEWMLEWLDHRCSDERAGYLLGHMQGNTATLTATLVTFAGDPTGDDWARAEDVDTMWALQWAQRLQRHLRLHPGSRQARGLTPRSRPVMLSPVPIPDDLLVSEEEAQPQSVHGDLPAAQLDRILTLNSSGVESSHRSASEQAAQDREVRYLASLQDLPAEPPAKVRVLMMQLGGESSSGSTEVPRRTLRIPLPEGQVTTLSMRLWVEEEEDQDEVATQVLPGIGSSMVPTQGDALPMPGGASAFVGLAPSMPADTEVDLGTPTVSEGTQGTQQQMQDVHYALYGPEAMRDSGLTEGMGTGMPDADETD